MDLYSGCLVYELNGVPCEINFDGVDIETIEETYGNVVRDRVLRFEVIAIVRYVVLWVFLWIMSWREL